jgi:hypothetical protein
MEALKGFFNEDGSFNQESLKEIMPEKFNGTPEEYGYLVLSSFRLPMDFIRKNFTKLNLKDLLTFNEVTEDIIIENAFHIASEILIEQVRMFSGEPGSSDDLVRQFFICNYSSRAYDIVFGELFSLLDDAVKKIGTDNFSNSDQGWENETTEIINECITYFSRDFVAKHISPYKFNIMKIAFMRDDMYDVVRERIDEIPFENLCNIMVAFEKLPVDENGRKIYDRIYTEDRERKMRKIFLDRINNDFMKMNLT